MKYQISSGQGPAECELGVAKLADYFCHSYGAQVLSTSPGYNKGTYRSVQIFCEQDLSEYVGSIQWICRSPYRPTHKRKNWFIDFSCCDAAEMTEFLEEQVVFETFRSGGKGGQNVNKVETGVRAIYLPTGQAVVCTEERSQYANKQKAVARLKEQVKQSNRQQEATAQNNNWSCHNQLKRGNANAVFRGERFVKD